MAVYSATVEPPGVRDVYSPDSNDSGIDADQSVKSHRYRGHETNPEPETAETGDDNKSRQQQVGLRCQKVVLTTGHNVLRPVETN